MKKCFHRGFEFFKKMLFTRKNLIYQEKSRTATKASISFSKFDIRIAIVTTHKIRLFSEHWVQRKK